ncbi:MAG: YHYH domain-containing protein [Sphingomonadales bacterium]
MLAVSALVLANGAAAEAHKGRTDKYGCHTQKSSGKYHCHKKK